MKTKAKPSKTRVTKLRNLKPSNGLKQIEAKYDRKKQSTDGRSRHLSRLLHDSDNPAEQEVSQLISSLRKEGLLTKKKVEPPSVVHGKTPYERTKHLLEVLTDLPADLSTNPKYWEGFGQ